MKTLLVIIAGVAIAAIAGGILFVLARYLPLD